jgi:hypothetical protein
VNQPDETLFFEDPTVNRSPPGDYGILYLLRRDITRCMDNSILWPAAMAIMAGIDLLAKFETGDDRPGSVSERFKAFIKQYFAISTSDAETIYQLRNSLLHSFGLYDQRTGRRFQVDASGGSLLITSGAKGNACISLLELHAHFERAVQAYRLNLKTNSTLQAHFAIMFPKYGAIPIRP